MMTCLLVLAVGGPIYAAPVLDDMAAQAAANWPVYTGLSQAKRVVSDVLAAPEVGPEVAWIIRYDGGGWAIAAGDDLLLPVYAYSAFETFPEDDNPAINVILEQMSQRLQIIETSDRATLADIAAAKPAA